ncbi:hypothetical protein MMC07_003612 [Pseudocyphellaria aurata]|nr:hypothetical protein [Pseudocyphellaria aurata]
MVIHKIEGIQASRQRAATPPPLDHHPDPLLERTSRSAKKVIILGKKLQQHLEARVDLTFHVHVDRFMRRSIASAYSCQIAERDLIASYSQAAARTARKKFDGKVAQKGGVITVRDIRAKVTKRADDDVEKAMQVLERAAAVDKKRQLL